MVWKENAKFESIFVNLTFSSDKHRGKCPKIWGGGVQFHFYIVIFVAALFNHSIDLQRP